MPIPSQTARDSEINHTVPQVSRRPRRSAPLTYRGQWAPCAAWCGRERSGRHGPARLDAAKACATVAVLGRRADGDGRSVAAACRGGGTPCAASALSEARSGSAGERGWRDVSSGCRSRSLRAWADDRRQQLAPGAVGGSRPPSKIQVAGRLVSGQPRRGTPPATRWCSWRVAQREPCPCSPPRSAEKMRSGAPIRLVRNTGVVVFHQRLGNL